jgi:tRNA(Ile)-lysidine synthase
MVRYADDDSNVDRSFARNRVRLDVLPRMEQAVPDVRRSLVELACGAREAAAALDELAREALVEDDAASVVALDRARLTTVAAELGPYAFRLALIRLLGDARDFEAKHYRMLQAAVHGATGATYQLPRGVVATVDAGRILLSRGALRCDRVDTELERALPFDGVAGAWSVRVLRAGDAAMADGGVDLRVPEGAVVRARRAGDRVRVRAGSKKLADWYIDRKIPRRERESAPVIAYGNQVLWTPWGAVGELPHGQAWRVVARRHKGAPAV